MEDPIQGRTLNKHNSVSFIVNMSVAAVAKSQVDLGTLERPTLLKIIKHYGALNSDAIELSKDDLVALATQVYQNSPSMMNTDIVDEFSRRFCMSTADKSQPKKASHYARELLDSQPASLGEQVAAKFSPMNENGSWVLGNIVDYDINSGYFDVQDDDDVNMLRRLSDRDVRRLDDSCSHLKKGDVVYAVFPETTSFYRAIVAKKGHVDVIVKFDDDEDEKCPLKRVPARFVLRADVFDDDDDYFSE